MSEAYRRSGGGGAGDQESQQQVLVLDVGVEGSAAVLPPFGCHVPQQSRREKLRYHPQPQGGGITQVQDLQHPPPPPPPSQQHPSLFLHPHYGVTAPLLVGGPGPSSCIVNPSYSGAASQFDHHSSSFFPTYHNNGGGVVSLSLSSSSYHSHYPSSFMVDASAAGVGGPTVVVPPSEPFAGYVPLLKRSRFLKPAQEMLEEVCGAARFGREVTTAFAGSGGDEPAEMLAADLAVEKLSDAGGGVADKMRATLISMLDEVYRRYKQYYQQILTLITSFDSISGLYGAAPYASLALRSLTKNFRCMKDAIADQLQFADKSPAKDSCHREKLLRFGLANVGADQYKGSASTSNIANAAQPPLWRPQRGLPEQAVAVLKAWLYEHFLHPYPTDADKHMLAKQTGLTRNQVSNWFINARVRLWKPLVVEVHSLEMQEASNTNNNQNGSSSYSGLPPPPSAPPQGSKRPSRDIDAQKHQNASPPKHLRNDFAETPSHAMEQQTNFSLDNYSSSSHHHHGWIGGGAAQCSEGRGGVSLTLALNQNNGMCLSDSLPLNVARRFGLEVSSDPYVLSGFEVQDHGFGKDIDGQFLRDFVG